MDSTLGSNEDKLLYLGHVSLRITTREGKVIYIDPYAGEVAEYELAADLILVTHGHYDHDAVEKVKNRNDDCQVITWREALAGGKHQTFDLGYVKVEAVEAGYNQNHDVRDCVGYILTLTSRVTLYVAGDTSTTPEMSQLAARHLDYAFLPCDGIFNMDTEEASRAADLIKAKHSIPYHTKPGEDFDAEIAEKFHGMNKLVVKNGEEIVLTHG